MQPFGCKGTTKSMFRQSPFYGMLHTMFMAFSCLYIINYYKIGCKGTTKKTTPQYSKQRLLTSGYAGFLVKRD